MKYTLTIQERHFEELYKLTVKEDKKERPALMLCGRSEVNNDVWDGGGELRFLSKEVIAIPDTYIKEHSEDRVEWNTEVFRKLLKRAKEENLQICLVHSHPSGYNRFSETDDQNELVLFDVINKRNGTSHPNLSLIILPDKSITARVCTKNLKFYPIDFIRVLGSRFTFFYKDRYTIQPKEEFHRQQLAFGPALNTDLSKLKIAIVGCGATGSATAHLLARLGVGHLLLIDNDLVERSNLSRLYGATSANADAGSLKVKALAEFITNIGIGCRVRYIQDWVGSEQSRHAIRGCDIIFGCTDDNSGRIFLNRLAYFYLIPVIDMGIVIEPSDVDPNRLQALQGRVTVIQPGSTCLLCRRVVDPALAREEQLKRNDPQGFARQKEEAYVIGSGNPSPAVITFTSEVASMSVNELINRLTGFKKNGPENHLVRFFDQSVDRKPHIGSADGCPVCNCDDYWGQGDMKPFLDQVN